MLPMMFKRFLAPLLTLVVALLAVNAAAQGQVHWKKKKITESNESWYVELEFHMKKAPDIAVVPMRFEFKPEVYYERTLVDGKDEPVTNKMVLEDRQPLVESVDIGFMNPGSGKIESRTRFSFKITRERGFEAGEYTVTLEDKRNGKKLGSPINLTLNGENPVVDRRSISFDPSKKKKVEKEPTEEEKAAMEDPPDPDSEEFWAGGPEGKDDPNEPALPPPAHMQERPCACRVPGGTQSAPSGLGLLGLLTFALFTLGIRRPR